MDIQSRLGKVLLWGSCITTLFVTPFISYDAINVPRFLALSLTALIALSLLLAGTESLKPLSRTSIFKLAIGFIVWSAISLFASKINITEGLFGVSGRNTGFLTYFAFVVLMLSGVVSANRILLGKLATGLVSIGLLSSIYGALQAFGGDPISWTNPFSPVFGVFGNPNFQASFMGITASSGFALLISKSAKIQVKVASLILIAFGLFNIYKSKSQQGYLVMAIGFAVIGFLFINSNQKFKKFKTPYLVTAGVVTVAAIADMLQKAPWASILYKESVSYRGDFWRAGWKITTEHPIFGVGLDGYRDHYRAARDLVTAFRPGSDTATDSAHNVFLDISSGGGFPLLLIYVAIVVLVIRSAIKIINRMDGFDAGFDAGFAAVFAAWTAYIAQSLISINQIGLAVWGWVLSGVLIGYEMNTRENGTNSFQTKIEKGSARFAVAVGTIAGLIIASPLYVSDISFRSSIKSGKVAKIESAVLQWPRSVIRMSQIADLFRRGNVPDRSLLMSREAVKFNPSNFEAWRELYQEPNATEAERELALKTMLKLDPLNPNFK